MQRTLRAMTAPLDALAVHAQTQPDKIAVVVDEMLPREGRPEHDPMLEIRVNLFVERPSQKAIVIGRRGARLKQVGTSARQSIEALLGRRSTSTCT